MPRAPRHDTGLIARRTLLRGVALTSLAAALSACAGNTLDQFSTPIASEPPPGTPGAPPPGTPIGTGNVRVALLLPLSGQGNAGLAAQSMKNAAEMAIAEFKDPNVQLLVKDNGSGFAAANGEPPTEPWSLKERVERAHGSLSLFSEPGCTDIVITLPLAGAPA